jgi:LysR family glycine cleavage system transcriptional activator
MARRLPSLNALKAFEAAARLQSLTLAAGELNVAQAAISRHVRELEAWTGTLLFHRTGRGVSLTDDGAILARDLSEVFDKLAAAVDRFDTPGQRKRLVVACDVSFAALWLVPRLKSFISAHPEIELVVDPATRLVDYAKGEADIGIRYGHGAWPGVRTAKLFDADASPVCSPRAWASAKSKEPAGLIQGPLIREDQFDCWPEWFAAAGIKLTQPLGGTQVRGEMAIAAAEAGTGFALADDVQCGDALMSGRLVRPYVITVGRAGYYLVHAEGAKLSRSAVAFRDWLMGERDGFLRALKSWAKGRSKGR